jgi:Flp pilus assembly protein TadG
MPLGSKTTETMARSLPTPKAARWKRRSSRHRRGIAAVEAALVFPLMVTLLLGTWEVSRLVEVYQILNNAVREGGRQAAAGQISNSAVQQVVLNYMKNAGLPTTNATVTVSDLTTPGTDATNASELDMIQITATIPFKDARWLAATLVTNTSTVVSVTNVWWSNNNQDYPTNISVPQGY